MTVIKETLFKIIKWLTFGLLSLLLIISILFGLIQTDQGKKMLADRISTLLSREPDFKIRIEGLGGFIPFDLSISRISVRDGLGEYVAIDDLLFRWSPLSLVRRPILINTLDISAIQLNRAPVAGPREEKKEKSSRPLWPPPIPPLVVENLEIRRLELDERILGERASFQLKGAVPGAAPDGQVKGGLTFRQTDKPGTLVEIDFHLSGQDPVLFVRARLEEPEDGLIHLLSGLKDTGHMKANLEGRGPLSAWQGHLLAGAEKVGEIETDLNLSIQKALTLKMDGRITLHDSLAPSALTPLFDSHGTLFTLNVAYSPGDQINADNIELKNGQIYFNARGSLDLNDQKVDSQYALQLKDLSVLDQTDKRSLKGRLDIQGLLSGSIGHPQIKMTAGVTGLKYQDFHASEISLDLVLQDRVRWPQDLNDLMIKVDGRIKGFRHAIEGTVLPRDPYQWNLEARLKKTDQKVIKISDLIFQSRDGRLAFSGTINPAQLSLNGKASLDVPELASLTSPYGQRIEGKLYLEADLEADLSIGNLTAFLKGNIREVGGFQPELDLLIQAETGYSARVDLFQAEKVRLADIKIQNVWMEMTGETSIFLNEGGVEADTSLYLPDLAVFSSLAQRPLEGEVIIYSTWKGPLSNLHLESEARGSGISVDGRAINQLELSLLAQDLTGNPAGRFRLDLQEGKNSLRTTSGYALHGSRLTLSDLALSGAGIDIQGGLDIELKEPSFNGILHSRETDISALSDILGEALAGRMAFEAILQSRDRGQQISLTLDGQGLASRFGQAGRLELEASLEDLFERPTGNLKAVIEDFRQTDLTLALLSLEARGNMSGIVFALEGVGDYHGPFELSTKGSMERAPGEDRLKLDQLQGQFQDNRISLVEDLIIIKKNSSYELKPAQLELGPGSLRLYGGFSPEQLSGEAVLEDMPLKTLTLSGLPAFLGSASGQLHLSGRPDHPEASLGLQINDLSLEDTSYLGLPPAQAVLEIKYADRLLQGSLTARGLSEKPLQADLEIPVGISLSPVEFQVLSAQEISGHIRAEFELDRFPAFFYLQDQSLSGLLFTELDVAGSLKKPDIKGSMTIRNGAYEHLRHGILLKDLRLTARMEHDRLWLENAEANDGERGRISAGGWIELHPEEDFPVEIGLQLFNCTLVRRDDFSASADGNLALAGNIRKALLSGRITVGPAELKIPDRLPPGVPDLQVTEINLPSPKIAAEKKPARAEQSEIDLDLNLDFPGRIFVRGRGLDSEWQGNLRVSGQIDKPVMDGQLNIVRGRYEFFGKPFALPKGILTLTGSSPPSPEFDILAEHKQSDLITRLGVRGNPSSLVIDLTSEPALPSDEILSRLLFGRNAAAITPFQALRLAAALNSVSGGAGGGMFDFMDDTRRLIGLDQLSLKQSGENDNTSAVSAGKYLGENIYLEVEKGLGSEGDKVSVEVRITPNITVESEAGMDGQGGIGLNWEWSY